MTGLAADQTSGGPSSESRLSRLSPFQMGMKVKQMNTRSLQAAPADGGDHGGEGEQDHHLRGDQETMRRSDAQDEA